MSNGKIIKNGNSYGGGVAVDTALDSTSTNPVQNKVVTENITQLNNDLAKYGVVTKTYTANSDHLTLVDTTNEFNALFVTCPNWYNNIGVQISNDNHNAYIYIRDNNGNIPASDVNISILVNYK
jgi:hypothetical protein